MVVVHVNLYTRAGLDTWWPAAEWCTPFFGLAVPTFFVISGYCTPPLGSRLGVGSRATARRLRHLMPPLLFWGMVLVMLGYGAGRDWPALILDVATGAWHLYFLFVLIQFWVVVSLLGPRAEGIRQAWVLAGAAALSAAAYGASDILLWTSDGLHALEKCLAKLLFPWSVFLVTGIVLRRRPDLLERLRRHVVWLAVLVAVSYFLYMWELHAEGRWLHHHPRQQFLALGLPFQWLGALLLLVVLDGDVRRKHRGWLAALRVPRTSHTYAVYLAHPAALVVIFALTNAAGVPTFHWVSVPLLATGAWILSWALWRLIKRVRLPLLERLMFGTAPP